MIILRNLKCLKWTLLEAKYKNLSMNPSLKKGINLKSDVPSQNVVNQTALQLHPLLLLQKLALAYHMPLMAFLAHEASPRHINSL